VVIKRDHCGYVSVTEAAAAAQPALNASYITISFCLVVKVSSVWRSVLQSVVGIADNSCFELCYWPTQCFNNVFGVEKKSVSSLSN